MMVGFLLFLNSQIGGAFFMNAGNRVGGLYISTYYGYGQYGIINV